MINDSYSSFVMISSSEFPSSSSRFWAENNFYFMICQQRIVTHIFIVVFIFVFVISRPIGLSLHSLSATLHVLRPNIPPAELKSRNLIKHAHLHVLVHLMRNYLAVFEHFIAAADHELHARHGIFGMQEIIAFVNRMLQHFKNLRRVNVVDGDELLEGEIMLIIIFWGLSCDVQHPRIYNLNHRIFFNLSHFQITDVKSSNSLLELRRNVTTS